MSSVSKRDKVNRSILILQLAVNLMKSPNLNDEDASLLAELVNHPAIQTALSKTAKTVPSGLTDNDIRTAVLGGAIQPQCPVDHIEFSYVLTKKDADFGGSQPNEDQ